MQKGSCLCGAVAFEIDAELADPIGCHCQQCRQQSGHFFSAVAAPKSTVRMLREATLAWYRHTDIATRGFCSACGSTLFWRGDTDAYVMVAMGSLDGLTGLKLSGHYWVDFKGDYYELNDGVPQCEGGGS